MKPRKPIRRVSNKYAAAQRRYGILRKEYLEKHPFCQIYIRRFNLDESDVIAHNGVYEETTPSGFTHWKHVPLAIEIHHSKSPKKTYLNDVSTWFAACREQHNWVKDNQSQARLQGVLI